MTNEITRENVQQIVDRNAAENKRKEAALEAQERKLRRIINQNHLDKTTVQTAAKARQLPQEEPEEVEKECVKALEERPDRRAQLAQEAESCNTWYQFLLLVFAPLILASGLIAMAGGAPITIPLLLCMAAYIALILATAIKAFYPKLKTLAAQNWPKVKEYIMYLSMV